MQEFFIEAQQLLSLNPGFRWDVKYQIKLTNNIGRAQQLYTVHP